MRRVKKSVVVVTMMLFSMMLFSMTNVHAANKKLKVNKVYTTTKKIKGKTKKKYLVKVKIGKKIYKKKASSKGNFTIPIPKQKVGKKLTVKAYRKKNKKWKLYAKKTITVKKKTVKATTKSKYPGKEDAIDFEHRSTAQPRPECRLQQPLRQRRFRLPSEFPDLPCWRTSYRKQPRRFYR